MFFVLVVYLIPGCKMFGKKKQPNKMYLLETESQLMINLTHIIFRAYITSWKRRIDLQWYLHERPFKILILLSPFRKLSQDEFE